MFYYLFMVGFVIVYFEEDGIEILFVIEKINNFYIRFYFFVSDIGSLVKIKFSIFLGYEIFWDGCGIVGINYCIFLLGACIFVVIILFNGVSI